PRGRNRRAAPGCTVVVSAVAVAGRYLLANPAPRVGNSTGWWRSGPVCARSCGCVRDGVAGRRVWRDLKFPRRSMRIHILGICGTFMGGIAALAREMGHQVEGSDTSVYPPMSDQLR